MRCCPVRKRRYRPGLHLADDAALERVKDIAPASHGREPVVIYTVETPVIAPDQQHATIRVGYYCNGLCGAELELSYTLDGDRWRLTDKRVLSVS